MRSIARLHGHHRRVRRRRPVDRLVEGMRSIWQRILAALATYFPPRDPEPSPPLAKAAALREGALLSDHVDARSNKRVA